VIAAIKISLKVRPNWDKSEDHKLWDSDSD
jgi:hypothetical protein